MNIQEMSTAVQYRLPVKIFILNNEYMGMVRQWQELLHGGRYSESYTDSLPDFVKLAESYKAVGLRAKTTDELDDVIEVRILNDYGEDQMWKAIALSLPSMWMTGFVIHRLKRRKSAGRSFIDSTPSHLWEEE